MLATSAQTVFVVFAGAFFAVVVFKLLVDQIDVRGLLKDKQDGAFSPGRLQLLVVTLGGAWFYFSKIVSTTDSGVLPPVPDQL